MADEPTGQAPETMENVQGQEPETDASDTPNPWGDDFDAGKAWTLVQNLRGEVDEMKAERKAAKEQLTEAERKAQEAEEAKLAENEEYKTLAEKRAERILELAPLESQVKDLEAERDQYRDALQAHVDATLKGVPDYVRDALAGKSPIEVMEYVSKHGESFRKQGASGVPDSPNPNGDHKMSDEEKRKLAAIPGRDY